MRWGPKLSKHVYSSDFYAYIDSGSRASARAVAALLLSEMKIQSLVDVGAGHGAWAAEWLAAGVTDVIAVDGHYVNLKQLAVPAKNFKSHDLSEPLELRRKFDLVQSLEVAEHLSEEHAEIFIDSLVRHGDVVLFSAAVPNQGGEHHVNEQPPEYWRELFAARGYEVFDWVRPQVAANREVKAWYRFNSFLYANSAGQKRLSPAILEEKVPEGELLKMGGDLAWSLRKAAVRLVPTSFVKPIAQAKSIVETRFRA